MTTTPRTRLELISLGLHRFGPIPCPDAALTPDTWDMIYTALDHIRNDPGRPAVNLTTAAGPSIVSARDQLTRLVRDLDREILRRNIPAPTP